MFTYLQSKIATSGERGSPGALPRSNEPAAWDGQLWDQAKLDAARAAQAPGADGRTVVNDQGWLSALNSLSGITKKYDPFSTLSNDEYGQQVSAPNTGGWADKFGRGYIGAGKDADGNQLIQYSNGDSGFENPTGNNGRDRVAPTYRLDANGNATPVSAGTNYQASEWVNNGRDVAKGVATMVAAYFGGSWLAAYEAGAVAAPVAGAAATETGATLVGSGSVAGGGGGIAGAAGGSGSAIGAEAGAAAGAAAGGSGAGSVGAGALATDITGATVAEGAAGAGYGASGATGTAAGSTSGLTAAQQAYGSLEAGGAAAGYGGNATAAGTYGSAGASSGGGSLINGISNQSLASGAASLGSAYLQNQATNRAIDAQTNQSNAANALQLNQYNQTRQDNAPWRAAGENALAKLTGLLNDGSLTSRFAGKLDNEAGYQFAKQEGMRAVDNSASARGGIGGAALKAGARFAENNANQFYNDSFNRWNTENTGIYNRLSNAAGLGQQANALVGASGQNYANQAGNNLTNLGNAQGAAAINQGNIYGNLLNQGAAWGNQNNWWQG
jgi:hypothetical protein